MFVTHEDVFKKKISTRRCSFAHKRDVNESKKNTCKNENESRVPQTTTRRRKFIR